MNDETTGWIKLHRSILNWEWSADPKMFSLFVHLLVMANHEPGKWRGQDILRGQTVTGLFSLSDETGISVQSLRTSLKKLENTGELTIKSTNKYTVITIVKYEEYQPSNGQSTSKLTNHQQTTNKQLTTNKNKKNEKNEKNIYGNLEKITLNDREEIAKKYGVSLSIVENEFENLKLYCEAKGVVYKNYRSALINFVKNSRRQQSMVLSI